MEIFEKNNNNNIEPIPFSLDPNPMLEMLPISVLLIFDSCYIMGASCHPSLPSSDMVPNNTQLFSAAGHRAFTHIILNSISV